MTLLEAPLHDDGMTFIPKETKRLNARLDALAATLPLDQRLVLLDVRAGLRHRDQDISWLRLENAIIGGELDAIALRAKLRQT